MGVCEVHEGASQVRTVVQRLLLHPEQLGVLHLLGAVDHGHLGLEGCDLLLHVPHVALQLHGYVELFHAHGQLHLALQRVQVLLQVRPDLGLGPRFVVALAVLHLCERVNE